MKLRLNVPDVKIYLFLLFFIGEMISRSLYLWWMFFNDFKTIVFSVIVKSSGGDSQPSYWDETYSQPYFDNTTRRDITVTIGQTAHLHCRVRNLGDRAVSCTLNFLFALTKHKCSSGTMQLCTTESKIAKKI